VNLIFLKQIDVRFTQKRTCQRSAGNPLRANSGHSAIRSITSSARVSRAGTIREGLRRAKESGDQPLLEPASAAVPSAAKQQKDDYNDKKRGGIHM
jgi:hypothetical protein